MTFCLDCRYVNRCSALTVLTASQKHHGYRLVIVGHSLGAGSATLIALMLKKGKTLKIWRFPTWLTFLQSSPRWT